MRVWTLLVVILAGVVSLVASLFALMAGERVGALVLFLIASGAGAVANRMTPPSGDS